MLTQNIYDAFELFERKYKQSELEKLKHNQLMATRLISEGRELIKIEKMIGKNVPFELVKLNLDANENQKIPTEIFDLCRKIAMIPDIDSFTWLGREAFELLANVFHPHLRLGEVFKQIDLDPNNHSLENIESFKEKIVYYSQFRKIRQLNSNASFDNVMKCIKAGVNLFGNKAKAKIKNNKSVNHTLNSLADAIYTINQVNKTTTGRRVSDNLHLYYYQFLSALKEGKTNPDAARCLPLQYLEMLPEEIQAFKQAHPKYTYEAEEMKWIANYVEGICTSSNPH